ncbi:serine/threonine-protein phosphatase [Paenibacillus sp. MWE-103]|uniref:Serine/threonine-protein phosphatase n=1 Tax=Paenibacillus artemisiicola TaxID=1172618 RepID=A0ABS3WG19_9BACL|nr:ATP-binding SpoIIE family protein phosphatase [Paenibacillus artemisiicola]MBO7747274.1 serine/threonine-protein phosphatase [Paenibacillus artemisiicola]
MELTAKRPKPAAYHNGMLLNRLFAVYLVTMLAGVVILQAESLLASHFENMFPFPLVIVSLGALILAFALLIASAIRLRPVFGVLRIGLGREDEPSKESQTNTALFRLYRLPYELLGGIFLFGLLFSLTFHGYDIVRNLLDENADGLRLLGTVAGEQSLFIFIAIVLFTSVRRILRPVLMRLQPLPSGFDGRASVAQPLVITYTCTFIVTILSLLQLAIVTARPHQAMDPYKFGIIALFYFIMGLSLFSYVTMQFRQELRGLVRGIRGLVGGYGLPLHEAGPILHDEAGELAIAYRELQTRINREYESLERELKLAYNVQQKLLPPGDLTIGAYRITARCQSYREVGGDFFDVVSLGPSRFAIMIGDVSGKGLPAALLMSAQLLVFRSEIRRNGSPSEVLARMNRQLCEAMGEEGSVTIGVGVIDLTNNQVQYASAGHLSPYVVAKDGRFKAVDCSSLPIGIDPEASYDEISLQLEDGDRFLLYTDGLIEAVNRQGDMYSFDGLEAEIATWEPAADLADVVDDWLARMDKESGPGQDDRTVVVLELAGEYRSVLAKLNLVSGEQGAAASAFDNPFMSREWSLRSKLGDERLIALKLGDWIAERWPECDIREDVQTAVCEAMINAIEHGNKLQPNKYVTLIAQIGGMLAVCRVYDEGGGYFPRLSRDEDEMRKKLESEDPRGWGLVMIDTLADYWTTGRDERGFYTELYFMRKSTEAAEGQPI